MIYVHIMDSWRVDWTDLYNSNFLEQDDKEGLLVSCIGDRCSTSDFGTGQMFRQGWRTGPHWSTSMDFLERSLCLSCPGKRHSWGWFRVPTSFSTPRREHTGWLPPGGSGPPRSRRRSGLAHTPPKKGYLHFHFLRSTEVHSWYTSGPKFTFGKCEVPSSNLGGDNTLHTHHTGRWLWC